MDTVLMDRLVEVLNREAAAYENIWKLSENKTDVIVGGKVTELEGITRIEQSMILQLGKLEEEREDLVDKMAAELKVDSSDVTLSSLEKLFPKEKSEKLKNCQQSLIKYVNDLSAANKRNAKLIRNSLEYIDFSINILTNAGSIGNNYGNSGHSNDSKKKNFFDMKL